MSESTEPTRRALFILITDHLGGAERVTLNLASELAGRPGWCVELKVASARHTNAFDSLLRPSVRVRYGPVRNWYLSFVLLPFSLLFRSYDLVFTTHVYVNAVVSLLRRARLVRFKRLVMRESMSLFDRFSGSKRHVFSALYRCYGGEDLLIAQTSYMGNHVAPWLPAESAQRLLIVPNPVDQSGIEHSVRAPLDRDVDQRLTGRTNILFCGRLVDFKRPLLALEAFRLLGQERQSEQLVYMGAGPLEREVHERAAQLGIADRVVLLGRVANPYPVMAACQYGLLTSANEGFPNVVLEMMASGIKKVVATPCAGDLDCLTGVTVTQTHDPAELAAELRDAINSGEDCSRIYREVAASRSVADYLDHVLGVPA